MTDKEIVALVAIGSANMRLHPPTVSHGVVERGQAVAWDNPAKFPAQLVRLVGVPFPDKPRLLYTTPQPAPSSEVLEALRKIVARATDHPDDTDADRKRNLFHIAAHAQAALRSLSQSTKKADHE